MKNLAVKFHREGYNCSQCIIKAYEEKFGREHSDRFFTALNGIYNGFGVGAVCSVFVACVMVLALEFDKDEIGEMRMILCDGFYDKFGGINCSKLKENYNGCEYVIGEGAGLVEKIIEKYKN